MRGNVAKIEDSIKYVLDNEGGFTIDDGGPTMWGITKPDIAAFKHVSVSSISTEEVRDLSVAEATEIYRQLYWNKLSLDNILDQGKATAIFDIGVNRGISIGAKYAQKSATLCGSTLVEDGVIGFKSIAGINVVDHSCFIKHIESLLWASYQAIVAHNPAKYGIYLKGWEGRAKRLLTLV